MIAAGSIAEVGFKAIERNCGDRDTCRGNASISSPNHLVRTVDLETVPRLQFNLQVAAGNQNWLAELVVKARNAEETLLAVAQAN